MKSIFYLLVLWACVYTYGQGCSDAGFCTMGAMRPNQKFNKSLNLKIRTIEYTSYGGVADFKLGTPSRKIYDYFSSQMVDANIGISEKAVVQLKLPINSTIGNLDTKTGLSDLTVCITKPIFSKRSYLVNGSLGAKIPLGKPNLKNEEGRPLPMYYQPTLGTFDAIAGVAMNTNKWMVATGLQVPLTTAQNEFVWSNWNKTSDSAVANVYPRANKLRRGYDVMLRIERNFRFSKWNAYVGVLPIYRLVNDKFYNPKTAKYETIEGTKGLAMTMLAGAGYKLNVHSALKLLFGLRLVKRHHNADGLSRLAVTSLSYEYSF